MTTRRFVLSTVGISLLSKLERDLYHAANDVELPRDMQSVAEKAARQALAQLESASVAERRAMSAELNGLYGLYEDQLHLGQADTHFLLVTDTALGEMAGRVVEDFLRGEGWSQVSVQKPHKLSTATADDFSQGIKKLIEWCEKTIPGYQDASYEIVFNLTGGFKSLQGYLNIVGMFYADRMVYIFEAANELLTIPRLPIEVSETALRDHRVPLALMAEGDALLPVAQVREIPEGLWESVGQLASVSNWGLLVWNRVRRQILSERLLDFPRLQYDDAFQRDFTKATVDERVDLQRALAQVSALLTEHAGNVAALKQHTGLQYDNYTNQYMDDGRPIGHFRLNRGRRVSCVAEPGGILVLRRFGEHDQVNDNP